MNCPNMFDNGTIHCECGYTGADSSSGQQRNYQSFSILMHLEHEYCNAGCAYCCCHPAPFDISKADLYSKYKADYKKMTAKIKETVIKRGGDPRTATYHFDIWGGEPLFNFKAFKSLVAALRNAFPDCDLTSSTNGILLADSKVIDFLCKNNISMQLSHDGYGQWLRTKSYDPMDNPKVREGLARLARDGLFTAINTTLNYYNWSFNKNIDYWLTKLKGIITEPNYKMFNLKLNHIYNSDYDLQAVNVDGRWQDSIREDLKGTKVGNVALRGRILDDYLQEFFNLAMMFRAHPEDLGPMEMFRGYIMEQSKRWKPGYNDATMTQGACRAYQAYAHNIPGIKQIDHTFVINTIGEYCECNLCEYVDDPGAPMLEYCKDCKYNDQAECHPCGSMHRPKEGCGFLYKWCQTLEKLHLIDKYTTEATNQAARQAANNATKRCIDRLTAVITGGNNGDNRCSGHTCNKCRP